MEQTPHDTLLLYSAHSRRKPAALWVNAHGENGAHGVSGATGNYGSTGASGQHGHNGSHGGEGGTQKYSI